MFKFPPQSEVNVVVPKDRFPRNAREYIEKVIWENKIQRETCNLSEDGEVVEFAVLHVSLKTDEISNTQLLKIARGFESKNAIPILWRFFFKSGGHCFDLAFPRASHGNIPENLKDCENQYIFATHRALEPAIPPSATSICELWKLTLCDLAEINYRANESMKMLRERLTKIRSARQKIKVLNNKLATEKQLNRQHELFTQKRTLEQSLNSLII